MSYFQAYRDTVQQAQAVVDRVQADQLDGGTPCEEWSGRQLLNHMIAGNLVVGATASGEQVDFTQDFTETDDLAGTYAASARQALDALDQVDADRELDLPWGQMTAGALANIMATDQYVHAWDLAVATDQDRTSLDADLGASILAGARQLVDESMRRPGVFASEVAVADDAPVQDQLAGFLGRRVP